MQNGQPLPDEQSDGFKSCSRWKLQRLPGMPAASLIQTQASVAGRSSLTCTYSRTSTSATILQNRVQAVPPGSQANCMRTDILVEKLYRRTVNTHNKEINNSLMKPFFLLVFLLCSAGAFSQKVALKNNLTYDTLKTTNLSLEFSMRRKWTLGTQVGMNFFFYTQDATSSRYKTKKASHWLVQPELRYWTCDVFNGWFFGLHAHGGQMNIGGIDVPFVLQKGDGKMKEHRYERYFWGGGLSAGYQWVVSNRFNIEASLGIGYVHTRYDKYKCTTCGKKEGKGDADYIGPTRAAISIIYMLK